MKYRYLPVGVIFAISLARPALADARDDVMAGASRCASIPDAHTWLNCFYGAAQPLRAQLGLAPAPAAQVALVPPALPGAPAVRLPAEATAPAATPQKANGGLLATLLGDSGHPLVSKIAATSYTFNNDGLFTVTLANGQVWTQTKDTSKLAHWRGPASQLVVSVTPGALNTFNLAVAGENDFYKVRRLR